jgi:CubicO group peptidase (beta-lactamase class C family)
MDLNLELAQLLEEGLTARLFSGASIEVITPVNGLISIVKGTHAFDDPKPVTEKSLFDLASVSKTIVAAAIVSLVEEGLLDPDEPIAPHLVVGHGPGAKLITLRHLLTHTSGISSDIFVWKRKDLSAKEKLEVAFATPLEGPPGATFRYSCFSYIVAGKLAEIVSGKPLSELVSERVTKPLGLKTMTYWPVDRDQAVATEDESYIDRGMVRGEVHDENSWSLGGQVGNAGIFATASDVMTFAKMFIREDDETIVLGKQGLRLMSESTVGPEQGVTFGHGMGLRFADPAFMGDVKGLGHTGFTGTMFVVDRKRETAAVLLTNRVHPQRDRIDLSSYRVKFSNLIAAAVDSQ